MANGDCSLLIRPWERATATALGPNRVGSIIVAKLIATVQP